MKNMQPKKVPMPMQDPHIRRQNFGEVALGYTDEMAIEEAKRCLECKTKPCISGCPVNVHIPDFIKKVAEGDFDAAYEIISETNTLPGICGRVCPQEKQCEARCVRAKSGEPVAIGRLERFVADRANKKKLNPTADGKKVAVIGSGPSGLACAGDLAKMGYKVTVFEALHKAGGVLLYGIPEFRLPKRYVDKNLDKLKSMGVEIVTNVIVGKSVTIDELLNNNGYLAVYIATGAGLPNFQNIKGENLNGVYSSNEFLTRINLMQAYDKGNSDTPIEIGSKVAVIGGGNVAIDAARSAKRMSADHVYIVYRRTMDEMPARNEEIKHAQEEDIIFLFNLAPVEILGNREGWAIGLKCQKMQSGVQDANGMRTLTPIPGEFEYVEAQTVIIAIGNRPNPIVYQTTPQLKVNKWGGIIADEETCATNIPGVYAGGDAVTGAATVILAMGAGKKAAKAIDRYIKSRYLN